jgi:hypothetical protein
MFQIGTFVYFLKMNVDYQWIIEEMGFAVMFQIGAFARAGS